MKSSPLHVNLDIWDEQSQYFLALIFFSLLNITDLAAVKLTETIRIKGLLKPWCIVGSYSTFLIGHELQQANVYRSI